MIYEKKDTLLRVENVNFSYGQKPVLQNINFDIKDIVRPDCTQGQVVALIGQSGSGKSTLFNILAGLLTPDSGSVLQGQPLRAVRAGDMGVVYQNYYLYGWRKVEKLLWMAIEKNPAIKEGDRKTTLMAIAGEFGIAEHLGKYPCQLSGGQQQRVAIAEQILVGGDFLLLDEPFSGLDTLMVDKVIKMLLKVSLSHEFKTIIVVSHDLSNAIAISDTVFVLSKAGGDQGATIVKEIDLIERGLAWNPEVKRDPRFAEMLNQVKLLL